MFMKSFAAAAAMTVALCAAAPAAALTLTFNVHVESASDGSPLPTDFEESWTFHPILGGFGPFVGYRGPADPAFTSLSQDLLALVGLPEGMAFSGNTGGLTTFLLGPFTSFDLFQSTYSSLAVGTLPNGNPEFDTREYRHNLSLQSPGLYAPASFDDAGVVSFLLGFGPLNWTEGATHTIGGVYEGDPVTTVVARAYAGKATLIKVDGVTVGGAVPEPGTWALMILGFGAAGAMLRRRRFEAA